MLELHGTPRSHFTRKLRILMTELGVPFAFVPAESVLARDAAAYANNPLLRIPALVDGDQVIFESDHIARYLVRAHDPADRFGVTSERVDDLNRLAVTSGIMDNEVVLILAARGGLADLDSIVYFQKLSLGIANGLAWLDARTAPAAPGFDYRDIALVCMWQHLAFYALGPDLGGFPNLAARVARFADRPSVATTAPA